MYKVKHPHEDGRTSSFIVESYDGEAEELFKRADKDAGEEVDVLYVPDDNDNGDIELWRQDWI